MNDFLKHQHQSSSGFVLLTVIGVILILSLMIGVLMQQMSQSGQVMTTALEHHHAQMALSGTLERLKADLKVNPKRCESQKYYFNEGSWGGIEVEIDCQLMNQHYEIAGTAKYLGHPQSIINIKQKTILVY